MYLYQFAPLSKFINAYSSQSAQSGSDGLFAEIIEWLFWLPLVLFAYFLLFTLPVLIFRFAILRRPVSKWWKASLIGWGFWFAGFLVIAFFKFIELIISGEYSSFQVGFLDLFFFVINLVILMVGRKKLPQKPQQPSVNAPNRSACQSEPTVPVKTERTCSECGASVFSGSKFCAECGAKIPPPVPDGMVICPECCKTVYAGRFCNKCGHKFFDD